MQSQTQVSPFFETVLRDMRNGRSLMELSGELAQLIGAVRSTGKPGKLVYTLVVKPAGEGEKVTLQLADSLDVKTPKLSRGASIFFATDDNRLTRTDPRQFEMLLAAVPMEQQAVVHQIPNEMVG